MCLGEYCMCTRDWHRVFPLSGSKTRKELGVTLSLLFGWKFGAWIWHCARKRAIVLTYDNLMPLSLCLKCGARIS